MGDPNPDRAVLSWSGGKDAAYALYALRTDRTDGSGADLEVAELLTTVSAATGRTGIHGVRPALIERQAARVGLPWRRVDLPENASNEAYERTMHAALSACRDRGVERVIYADLLLTDVREYREALLDRTGLAGVWPLWGRDTAALADAFLDAGFAATVVCVDGDRLDASFAGRPFDASFLRDLPADVDPCGENGEFHTFVHDGPLLEEPVAIERGRTVTRPVGDGRFHYCDLLVG